ncbi:MAG: P1 family peptidase [Acidimicrobiales bacterium]|nr:P1 family peptidase [Acidimicrobiales bacterium]
MSTSGARARELGIPFAGTPGTWNSITDVGGTTVGMTTLIAGDGPLVAGSGPVRTGVTAIVPRGVDGLGVPCVAGWYSLNGNGEMTGTTWIEESGALTTPVVITNTHAVGACHTGVVRWIAERRPDLGATWLLPVVAETWDGYLNDINGGHVTPEIAMATLDAASTGPVAEGSVGGGTGMNCYGFKGGSGTASRMVEHAGDSYVVAAFVQANFGSRHELTIAGVHLGELLAADDPMTEGDWLARDRRRGGVSGAGSVIVVIATDAPLLPHQCKALARRVPLGLARTGTTGGHFSGDIFLAYSTANAGALTSEIPLGPIADGDGYQTMRFVPWGHMDALYEAVVQSVEEAVVNALVANRALAGGAMIGRDGHRSPSLPVDRVLTALDVRPSTTGPRDQGGDR